MLSHTNKLIHETSPYLLQHAHNPVNWYPWGDEALQRAKREDKPILVSIGYSACHWCHVMERESFEDEETAKFMNEHFINIKIDREERPDLDHIYMDALQAMIGSGGWPLNVFLTPEKKPFYGGTYFPPKRSFNLPSWKEVLHSISQVFREKRNEIDAQSENLVEHLFKSNSFGQLRKSDEREVFKKENLEDIFKNLMKSANKEWGGFGKAPKFPQVFCIQFLLRYHHISKNKEALQHALLSLDKMMEGGIYDQVGGGFARYSTDNEWLAPHFEKMLYDNALLVSVLCEAFQLTQKDRYKEAINETMKFIQREMTDPEGGFYSALDADSEGEEGKFYVWEYEEVQNVLGAEAIFFCEYYDITPQGNWEKKNILRVKEPIEKFSDRKNMDSEMAKKKLEEGRKILLEERSKRTRPQLDDKIILGWNALMNIACSKAFAATANEKYREMTIKNMHFLLDKFHANNNDGFYHTWKNGTAKFPAFLDDYAFLIQALINLQEITADTDWLIQAKAITEFVLKNFSDNDSEFFFYTKSGQEDIIVRKKEMYDGALPSGNSVMAYTLYHLSVLFEINDWKERCINMIMSLAQAISHYPTSFGIWACLLQEMISGTNELVIRGIHYSPILIELLGYYIPHKVLITSATPHSDFPLLINKPVTNSVSLYLCKGFACLPPVHSVTGLIALINSQDLR
ncbi:MAG TPA: thioredoxin domain-containing protein [Chitinophagaceae bacterium]|nr:thioredoxin domain-containing protein [Chitinophagaceae bacterium]